MSSSLADKWTLPDRLIQLLRYRKVLPHIPCNCVLADLGCGNGDFLRYIDGMIVLGYGVDTKVESAAGTGNLIYKEGDLNNEIPIECESVDVVTSLAVLEHLNNPQFFVGEVLRILKPGGYCIITTPAPVSKPLLEFLACKLRIISENDVRDHKHYFTKCELFTLFKGFKEIRIRYFQFGFNTVLVARKPAA